MFGLWKCSVESGTVGCNHVRRERERVGEWCTHASPSSTHGIDCGKTLFPFALKLVRREASVVLSSSRFNKYSHMHIERTLGTAHTKREWMLSVCVCVFARFSAKNFAVMSTATIPIIYVFMPFVLLFWHLVVCSNMRVFLLLLWFYFPFILSIRIAPSRLVLFTVWKFMWHAVV